MISSTVGACLQILEDLVDIFHPRKSAKSSFNIAEPNKDDLPPSRMKAASTYFLRGILSQNQVPPPDLVLS